MREAQALLSELLARPDVRLLTDRLKAFDGSTYRHCLRVARFAIVFARGDGLEEGQVRQLAVAAMLHDLGKTGIDPRILDKPGPLDERERHAMRGHSAAAVPDLEALDAFPDAHRLAPLHHELQGDRGYPRSGRDRRGEAEGARTGRRRALPDWMVRAGLILALADRYDALISHRAYKDPWPDPQVRAVLRREMPTVAPLLDHLTPPGHAPR